MEDRCVMCGKIIPEGRMVCPTCEANISKHEFTPTPKEKEKKDEQKRGF